MSTAAFSIETVNALMARGELAAAGRLLERAIAADPVDARLHWQLGACHATANRLALAHDCFREAIRLDGSLAVAHAALGALYLLVGIVDLALRSSTVAIALVPDNPKMLISHARILEAAGQMDAAWELVQKLVADGFINPGVLRVYGRIARYRDAQPAAIALTQQLLGDARLPIQERAALEFTMADLLDSLGQYDEAFAHAAAGNAATRPRYDPAAHARTFDQFIGYFTADRIRRLARSSELATKAVFIVGMPRSGTSLVEQILASHPAIYGGGELDFMERVFHGTIAMLGCRADEYPACLDRLTVDQAAGMGQIYRLPLIAMNPAARCITDKLPLNFLHLGLINLLLPGARVIHVRRDPLDTCLSCHLNSFAAGNAFKFDLTHLGLFYRQYERLMKHWSAALDLPICEVVYEELVADPEGQTHRLLRFLDLPFDPACLNFHRTDRAVLTSSLQQVRRPLYADSVHRWKHYEKHLGPLKAALAPFQVTARLPT